MQTFFNAVQKSLNGRMLGHALALMKPLAQELTGEPYMDRWQTISRNYRLVADYFMQGADDPQRTDVIDSLVREAYQLLDDMYLRKRMQESTSYEIREMLRPTETSDNAADAFRYFWLGPVDDAHLQRFRQLTGDPEMADEALMAVSALTLNLLRCFSCDGLLALIEAADERYEQAIRERAWVSLILVMLTYDDRLRFYPELTDAVQDMLDTEDGRVFATTASTCIIRTLGVDWAGGAFQSFLDRVSPLLNEMVKGVDGSKNFTPEEIDDFEKRLGPEFNDSMKAHDKELNEMREENLDSQYAMFSGMYSVPFFSEPYRWWLPYSDYYLPEEVRNRPMLFRLMAMDNLCDSDRYAFLCTMAQVGLINGKHPDELDLPEIPEQPRGEYLLCNNYVRQLYRFFRLNPWGIQNPLERLNTVASSPFFRLLYPSAVEKSFLAGHMMRCHAYTSALDVFCSIADALPTAEVLGNTAFCAQKTADYETAARFYEKAVQKEPTEWLLRQLEFCYSKDNQTDKALEVCEQLLALQPENEVYLYEKAKCLERLELFAEALQIYYRLDLLRPGRASVCRSVAWCSFLCDDFEAAEKYYCRLAEQGCETPVDWLNRGHLCFATGRRSEAFGFYLRCMWQQDSLKDFLMLFRPDRHFLLEKGVPKNEIYLMEDQLILAHAKS